MNDSNQKASGASRPSLMSAARAAPAAPDFSSGQAPTRVLADLGGSISPQRSRIAIATLVSGVIAVAAGGIYWANNSQLGTSAASSVQASAETPRVTSAATAAPLPAIAAAPEVTTAPAPQPAVASAARILIDETPVKKAAPFAIDAAPLATVSPAPAAPITAANAAPLPTAAKITRRVAADNARREKQHLAAATPASGKRTALAAKKARNETSIAASSTSTRKPVVAKAPDPDTDLLAALLRRNDGQAQASLTAKDRTR